MNVNPVVVVPIYKDGLDRFEQISLRHLRHYLSRYRLVLIKPEALKLTLEGLESISFPDRFFQSRDGYNELMLSIEFYQRFVQHSHMLIYQLDALVLRDELLDWCGQDIDYIGASWYQHLITKYESFEWPYSTEGCGNGGFSLRRIPAFINHLQNRRSISQGVVRNALKLRLSSALFLWKYRQYLKPRRYVHHESLNEDVYYGIFTPIIQPSFRVASPSMGDLFSFEYDPYHLFAKTGRLPFGCHAWNKFSDSLQFWTPYLLPD